MQWKPPPNRVFVKILQSHKDNIFSKMNVRNDGSISELFTEMELESNFEASFAQNVHIGEVVNVGDAVKDIQVGDIAIIDYLVDNEDGIIIGYDGNDKIVSVVGVTEYYDHSQDSSNERRLLYAEGDYKEITQIYGVVRNEMLVAIEPFIFVETKSGEPQAVFQFDAFYPAPAPPTARTLHQYHRHGFYAPSRYNLHC